MKKKCIAGIDIGGTSIKVIICDLKANQIAFAKSSTLPSYRKGDGKTADTGPQRDFNAEILWNITLLVLTTAIAKLPSDYEIEGIAVSTCGCTVITVDKNGKQIPFATPLDEAESEKAYYESQMSPRTFFDSTGYPLESDLAGIHLSSFCQTIKNNEIAHVLCVDDYIVYRLSGEYTRNYSTAVSTGMWDCKNNKWLDLFEKRSGLNRNSLGSPIQSGIKIGKLKKDVAEQLGLIHCPAICTGGMDYECAALTCNHMLKNSVFNITGTIDLMAVFSTSTHKSNDIECRIMHDYHVIPNHYSHMLETFGALQAEWLKNQIFSNEQLGTNVSWGSCFDLLEKEYAANVKSKEVFLPHIFGALIPKVDYNAMGVFMGLTRSTNSISLLKAVLEGMAFQSKRMLQYLAPNSDTNQVILVGGASKRDVWMSIKANILNMPIITPHLEEASAVGAALLAGVGTGLYASHEEAGEITKSFGVKQTDPDYKLCSYYNQIFDEVYKPLHEFHQNLDKVLYSL